jgi:hypothetical protein
MPIGDKKPKKVVVPKKVIKTPYRATVKPTVKISERAAKQWIISREGGPTSVNTSSYACGKPQANPCDKLLRFAGVKFAKTVKPWNYTYAEAKSLIAKVPASVQDAWMDKYVMSRYGSYANAMRYWQAHGNY